MVEGAALEPELAEAVRNRIGALYPDLNYLVNQQLSLALAHLEAKDLVEKTLPLLNAATEQSQQMHYLFVLRNLAKGWTPSARQNYFEVLAQTERYVAGEGMPGFLDRIRNDFRYNKRQLPVLVMTGDENKDNQSGLLREGANDLVLKPIEERLLVTKTLFQLRVAKLPEQRSIDA